MSGQATHHRQKASEFDLVHIPYGFECMKHTLSCRRRFEESLSESSALPTGMAPR